MDAFAKLSVIFLVMLTVWHTGIIKCDDSYEDEPFEPKTQAPESPPVQLILYYETLCPYSRAFINNQLWSAFNSVSSIMNVTLVPYGNANETFDKDTGMYKFQCQHGENECWANTYESCLIKIYPMLEDHLPAVNCIASNTSRITIRSDIKRCSSSFDIDTRVDECTESKMGNDLLYANGAKTRGLEPSRKYVPWITVNGKHTDSTQKEARTNLVSLVCKTYQGSTKPDVCRLNI